MANHTFVCIDAHTCGNPVRVVAGGGPLLILFAYRTATTWPGLVIVLLGVPVYFAWKPRSEP